LIETQGKEVIIQDMDTLYDMAGLNSNDECEHSE